MDDVQDGVRPRLGRLSEHLPTSLDRQELVLLHYNFGLKLSGDGVDSTDGILTVNDGVLTIECVGTAQGDVTWTAQKVCHIVTFSGKESYILSPKADFLNMILCHSVMHHGVGFKSGYDGLVIRKHNAMAAINLSNKVPNGILYANQLSSKSGPLLFGWR